MTLDLTRMTLPNRALHCYVLMSIWILLLVAGVYKFLETRETIPEPTVTTELFQSLAIDVKTKRIFKICNFPNEIIAGDEGIVNSNRWNLKGLIFLVRHGDRGPLQYIRNISAVNCAGSPSESLNSYKKYLQNLTTFEKIFWATPGSFHGFPLLPIHPTECQLGQLTMQGIHQHLVLGKILRDSYIDVWQKLKNLTYHDVLVYSTRYRRTFQSALAFLRSFLPHETLTKISILESQSMNFCFKDCGCPATEKLTKSVLKWLSQQLKSHPAVAILSESTGRSIFSPGAEQGSFGSEPHSVRDALLTYICHGGNLPCETPFNCIKRQNVAGIFAYTDWVNHQKWKDVYWKKLCLLKSYGLVKHIVQQMLHIASNSGPFFVLYSGHDHTIEQLTTTLGIQNDPLLLKFASRIIFEVYQDNRNILNNEATGVYFRVLLNGRDVTRQITFCKNVLALENKVVLCRIEDIVRFLHDDYFNSLNVTNFKEAC